MYIVFSLTRRDHSPALIHGRRRTDTGRQLDLIIAYTTCRCIHRVAKSWSDGAKALMIAVYVGESEPLLDYFAEIGGDFLILWMLSEVVGGNLLDLNPCGVQWFRNIPLRSYYKSDEENIRRVIHSGDLR